MEALKTIWDFFQNEVLGMNWLNRLIETFLNACGLDTTGKIGGSVQFFIYDTVKIMVLLGVLILIISYIQSYFPPERAKKILGRFHGIWANIIAALLGTVTPFCSASFTARSMSSLLMLELEEMVMCCSLPVPRSLADTFTIPLASMSKVTSI